MATLVSPTLQTRRVWAALALMIAVQLGGGRCLAGNEPAPEKYMLRYQFQPGETLRWTVEHRAQIRTAVSGTAQTVETQSLSTKAWQVEQINSQGHATFVYSVEKIDLQQRLTGRQEERYNSETDKEAPLGFQDVAKSVGVPLTTFTMDPAGKIINRREHQTRAAAQSEHPTLPLPAEPIAVGSQWSYTFDQTVSGEGGAAKKVQLRQQMTLEEVKNGVAIIHVETQLLSPVRNDPAIAAQVVQSETEGRIRFDIDSGRVLSLQTDVDKTVVGFRGEASSLHCVQRFSERLLPASETPAAVKNPVASTQAAPAVAGPAVAGPAEPAKSKSSAGATTSSRRSAPK